MQIRASAFEGESVSVTDLLADSLTLTGSATLDGLTAQGNVGCDQLLCNDVNCTDVFTTGVDASGAVSCAALTATGAVAGATLSSTGAVSGSSLSITGAQTKSLSTQLSLTTNQRNPRLPRDRGQHGQRTWSATPRVSFEGAHLAETQLLGILPNRLYQVPLSSLSLSTILDKGT